MSRSWCVGLSLLAVAVGCLLPEGTVDPNLDDDPDMVTGSALGGSGGAGGTSVGSGAGGGAGSTAMMGASGSGGTTSPVVPPPTAGTGGTMAVPDTGAGGAAGSQSMASAGAGGSAMRTPVSECSDGTQEETCGAYCQNYQQSCGDYTPAYTYTSLQDCLDTCNTPGLWPVGSITVKGSILCRCYHATLALNGDRATHCFHAAENPTLVGGCEL